MSMIDTISKLHLPVGDATTSGPIYPNSAETDLNGFDFSDHLATSLQQSSSSSARQMAIKPTKPGDRTVVHARTARFNQSASCADKVPDLRSPRNSKTDDWKPVKQADTTSCTESKPVAQDETSSEDQTSALGTPPAEFLAALVSADAAATPEIANVVTSTDDMTKGGPPSSLVATLTENVAPQTIATETEAVAPVSELLARPATSTLPTQTTSSTAAEVVVSSNSPANAELDKTQASPVSPSTEISATDDALGIQLVTADNSDAPDGKSNKDPNNSASDVIDTQQTAVNPFALGRRGTEDTSDGDVETTPDKQVHNHHPEAVFGAGQGVGESRSPGVAATHLHGEDVAVDPTRMLNDVSRSIQSFQQSGGNVRIKLHPPELGSLQIDVSVRNGAVSARLESQSAAAHRALTDNLSQLHEALSQLGVTVDRVDVLLADQRPGDNRSGMTDRSFQGGSQGDRDTTGNQGQASNHRPPQEKATRDDSPPPPHARVRQPMKQLDIKV